MWVGEIKGFEDFGQIIANDRQINAATGVIGFTTDRVAADCCSLVTKIGHGGLHRLQIQLAGSQQHGIPESFGGQPLSASASEQSICGILQFQPSVCGITAESKSAGQDDFANQVALRPATVK